MASACPPRKEPRPERSSRRRPMRPRRGLFDRYVDRSGAWPCHRLHGATRRLSGARRRQGSGDVQEGGGGCVWEEIGFVNRSSIHDRTTAAASHERNNQNTLPRRADCVDDFLSHLATQIKSRQILHDRVSLRRENLSPRADRAERGVAAADEPGTKAARLRCHADQGQPKHRKGWIEVFNQATDFKQSITACRRDRTIMTSSSGISSSIGPVRVLVESHGDTIAVR